MALGTWKIWNPHLSTPAWETLSKTNEMHQRLLRTERFFLQDDGLSGTSTQATDILPVSGDFRVFGIPHDITVYTAGTLQLYAASPEDTVNDGALVDASGAFHRPISLASGSVRAGYWADIPGNARIVSTGLTGIGTAKITLDVRRAA